MPVHAVKHKHGLFTCMAVMWVVEACLHGVLTCVAAMWVAEAKFNKPAVI